MSRIVAGSFSLRSWSLRLIRAGIR
jgi:hypothetical protein